MQTGVGPSRIVPASTADPTSRDCASSTRTTRTPIDVPYRRRYTSFKVVCPLDPALHITLHADPFQIRVAELPEQFHNLAFGARMRREAKGTHGQQQAFRHCLTSAPMRLNSSAVASWRLARRHAVTCSLATATVDVDIQRVSTTPVCPP